MLSYTTRHSPGNRMVSCMEKPAGRQGLTLVEVLVAVTIASMVLAAVLTTHLHLLRSGLRIAHYAEMEAQARRGLETLGNDLRIASGIKWNSASNITLTIPNSGGATSKVTYAWDANAQNFFRVPGTDSTATTGRLVLISGVPPKADGSDGVVFARFDRDGNAATTDLATKRIRISMVLSRQSQSTATATESISATFVLRNKSAS